MQKVFAYRRKKLGTYPAACLKLKSMMIYIMITQDATLKCNSNQKQSLIITSSYERVTITKETQDGRSSTIHQFTRRQIISCIRPNFPEAWKQDIYDWEGTFKLIQTIIRKAAVHQGMCRLKSKPSEWETVVDCPGDGDLLQQGSIMRSHLAAASLEVPGESLVQVCITATEKKVHSLSKHMCERVTSSAFLSLPFNSEPSAQCLSHKAICHSAGKPTCQYFPETHSQTHPNMCFTNIF